MTQWREGVRPLHGSSQSVDLDATTELLVLVTDEFDQLLIRQVSLIDAHGPWLGVGLRILEGRVDLQLPELRPSNAFGELRFAAIRTAIDVQPSIPGTVFRTTQVVGLDDERVAVPRAN